LDVVYTKRAVKAIERLDAAAKARIRAGIYGLPSGDIKKLKGYSSAFRLRVGDYRVIFEMTAEEIVVNDVLSRGNAYK
jgi:mRNA interferase RelE/StbE